MPAFSSFRLDIDTMFRAAQLIQNAYLRSPQNYEFFNASNAQLVAAAATFICLQLDDKVERSISLTDLSHSMDNRWTADAIWLSVNVLLTLHADKLGEPTVLDFILLYFCYDDDPVMPEVTRRTVTLAMLAACSKLLQDYPARVVAACVCSLARFPLPGEIMDAQQNNDTNDPSTVDVWPDALAKWTGLTWESLPMDDAKNAIQTVLRTPNLLVSKFAHDLSSVAHLAFLPSTRDLEMYRLARARKRARLET